MRPERRIVVPASATFFEYSALVYATGAPVSETGHRVEMHKFAALQHLPPELEADPWLLDSLRHELVARLERVCGWPPEQVRWSRHEAIFEVDEKPRWWELLRRLGLRSPRVGERVVVYLRAEVVGAIVPGLLIVERTVA